MSDVFRINMRRTFSLNEFTTNKNVCTGILSIKFQLEEN